MLSVLTTVLFLLLLLMAVGCVSQREVVYRSVYFADTNGVTTIHYPESMEKDLKTPHNNERWNYIVAKNTPDDGAAKEMKPLPTWEEWKQQKLSDEYHKEHPECSYGYQK